MIKQELKRPPKKIGATPLKEEDKYNFLPYISDDLSVLPSQADSYKTDPLALILIKNLKEGKNLSGQDFTGVNLKGADLSGLNLDGINLSKANLTQTNLSESSLKQVNLSYAYMENTCLDGADLTGADFKGVVYKNCSSNHTIIDEDNKKYLQTLEWLIEQIEQGKIKLPELPPEQLFFLDLRMMDLSKVDLSEVDLSMFVLDGVNLSGTYINKKHMLGFRELSKWLKKQKRIVELSEKALDLMMKKIVQERSQKTRKFAEEEILKKQTIRKYAQNLERPPKKENMVVLKKTDDVWEPFKENKISEISLPSSKEHKKVIGAQRAFRIERTQLKKRA